MSNVSNVTAKVYAAAILEIGAERGKTGAFLDDLQSVLAVVKADKDFRVFYESPKVAKEQKFALIDRVFKGRIETEVLSLLHILARKNRAPILDNIVAQVLEQHDRAEDRLHATAGVARELPEDQRKQLEGRLAAITGKKIVLHQEVKAELLGGMTLRLGDKLLDTSVRKKLDELRRRALGSARN